MTELCAFKISSISSGKTMGKKADSETNGRCRSNWSGLWSPPRVKINALVKLLVILAKHTQCRCVSICKHRPTSNKFFTIIYGRGRPPYPSTYQPPEKFASFWCGANIFLFPLTWHRREKKNMSTAPLISRWEVRRGTHADGRKIENN